MSPLVVTCGRLLFLALLWALVLLLVRTVRRDVFGATIKERRPSATPQNKRGLFNRRSRPQPRETLTHPRLLVTQGPLAGTSLELAGGALTFGRAPNCSLVLDDEYASSMHAKIFEREGRYYLADMESTNGTFLDDQPVKEETILQPGNVIRIGRTTIEFKK